MEDTSQQEKQELEYKNPNEEEGRISLKINLYFGNWLLEHFHTKMLKELVMSLHTLRSYWLTQIQTFDQHLGNITNLSVFKVCQCVARRRKSTLSRVKHITQSCSLSLNL